MPEYPFWLRCCPCSERRIFSAGDLGDPLKIVVRDECRMEGYCATCGHPMLRSDVNLPWLYPEGLTMAQAGGYGPTALSDDAGLDVETPG